jgi:hypothetical protein
LQHGINKSIATNATHYDVIENILVYTKGLNKHSRKDKGEHLRMDANRAKCSPLVCNQTYVKRGTIFLFASNMTVSISCQEWRHQVEVAFETLKGPGSIHYLDIFYPM